MLCQKTQGVRECVPVRRSRRARAFGTRAAALRRTGESVALTKSLDPNHRQVQAQPDKNAPISLRVCFLFLSVPNLNLSTLTTGKP